MVGSFDLVAPEQCEFFERNGYVVTIRSQRLADGRVRVPDVGVVACRTDLGAIDPYDERAVAELLPDTGYRSVRDWHHWLEGMYGIVPDRGRVFMLDNPR